MRHMRRRLRKQRAMLRDYRGALNFTMPHQRPDTQPGPGYRNFIHPGNARDIDEDFGNRNAQVQHRNQALAAGEDPRLFAMPLEQIENLPERTRPGVGKCGCFHCGLLGGPEFETECTSAHCG